MASPPRRIIHIDMDAFFASVEQRDTPALRGRPVAVGGSPDRRGVVAAASYEARAFGVHSAMPMARAVRRCPELAVVAPDFARYRDVSRAVFDLCREVTPLVEPLSLDEAYLDVTTNAWGERLATTVARRLKRRIREQTDLTASAGVAPNKFLAKIASGWRKPDGLTVIPPPRVERWLHELPVDALWGVGPKTAAKLRAHGIERLVDVRAVDDSALRHLVGRQAASLRRLAHGQDDRPVTPHRAPKSRGCEHTYPTDLTDPATIRAELERLALKAAGWLEERALTARTVTIKVRYADFRTITRCRSTAVPLRSAAALVDRVGALADSMDIGVRPVRLLGVSVSRLSHPAALAPRSAPLLQGLPAQDAGSCPT